jgi:hypothetical protein
MGAAAPAIALPLRREALAARPLFAAAQRKYRLDLSVSPAMAPACTDPTGNDFREIAAI